MTSPHRLRASTVALVLLAAMSRTDAQQPTPADSSRARAPVRFSVPVDYTKLDNGLKVVLSRDTTAPTAVVAVYYGIGFRIEPRDRTGFAHLFEHMMFQGSRNLAKLQFDRLVEGNGGLSNGSTRFDFTNYFEVVPSHTLETMLWAEADRMHGLQIDTASLRNQQDVVKSEVRVNVLNQPYGGFPWIDLPMAANTNWYNAHNFYGDFHDLDSATVDNVRDFFRKYYAPNNAVLVVVGDFDPARANEWVRKYFGDIPSATLPPPPDLSEPRQTAERRASRVDSLATRPALGLGYHVPERNTPEWYAFGIIDQILGQGQDAWLYDELVRQRGLTGEVAAGVNWGLGNLYDYKGPMLWIVSYFHDGDKPADSLLAATDRVIARLQSTPVDRATLDRALVKIRSDLYANMEQFGGFGRANLLASFALFDDDPARINQLEAEFAKVTPELIQRTAREYLRPTNRTVYTIVPGAKSSSQRSQ
jgi:predicted Zn-dependent peptidase